MITLAIGMIAIVFAIWIQDVLVALDVAYAILSGAIFIPVVMGFLWKKATAKAGFYSIIISTIVILVGMFSEGITSTHPIMYGMAASLLSMVVLTTLTKQHVQSSKDVEVV